MPCNHRNQRQGYVTLLVNLTKLSLEYRDLIPVIERVRRAMPRNPDVMQLCDALEVFAVQRQVEPMMGIRMTEATNPSTGPKRDRAAYMREYRARKA